MKKIITIIICLCVSYSGVFAYNLTNQDNILITKITNKLNLLIQKKGENYRDKYIKTLNDYYNAKNNTNERLSTIIKEIIKSINTNSSIIIKRENVGDEYKWKLTDIFKNDTEIENTIKLTQELIEKISKYKGQLSDNIKLLEYMKLNDEFNQNIDKLYAYSGLGESINTKDTKMIELTQRFDSIYRQYQEASSFFGVEIKAFNDDKINAIINNTDFINYKNIFKNIQKQKIHILSQEKEDVIAKLSDSYIGFGSIYNKLIDSDIVYPEITDPNGNKIPTNYANMYSSWNNSNRDFRKDYTQKYYTTYKSFENTLGALYISKLKEASTYAKIRNYDNVLQTKYQQNDLPLEIYDNLINVTNENLNVFHRYLKIRQDYLGLDKTHYYDTFTPIETDIKNSFTYNEAKQMILTGLNKLGKKYISGLNEAFNSNWIDVYQGKNKGGGAFCYSIFGLHPFISLNFNNTYDDVSTLGHELGHAMNAYFLGQKQSYNLYNLGYPVEIPSIANELIMLRGLANESKSDKEKLFYLDRYLFLIYTNYWRATMYGDFEKQVYTKIWNNESVTTEILNNIFENLFKKYYGPNFAYDDYLTIEWAIKPHFYSYYYTHEYAVSTAAANKIATNIVKEEKGFGEKYIDYLASGKSGTPNELLAKINIDMTKPEYIKSVSETQTQILDEMEEIIKRIKGK